MGIQESATQPIFEFPSGLISMSTGSKFHPSEGQSDNLSVSQGATDFNLSAGDAYWYQNLATAL